MSNDNKIMFNIANLYYNSNLTQEGVARKLGISKYKVNKVLKEARAKGIVRISVIKQEFKKND